jgi:hypothetical protein
MADLRKRGILTKVRTLRTGETVGGIAGTVQASRHCQPDSGTRGRNPHRQRRSKSLGHELPGDVARKIILKASLSRLLTDQEAGRILDAMVKPTPRRQRA